MTLLMDSGIPPVRDCSETTRLQELALMVMREHIFKLRKNAIPVV